MYSVADMRDLCLNKFSGLRCRRFTFSSVSTGSLQSALFRHFRFPFYIRNEFKSPPWGDGSSARTVDLNDAADFVHDLRHNDLVDFGAYVRAIADHDTQRLHQFFLRVRLQ